MKNLYTLIIALLIGAAVSAQTTLIKNVNIFDGVSDKLAMNQNVLIEKNLISKIGENLKAPKDATVIDGEGKTLMPGLIESHGHIQLAVTVPLFMSGNWDFIELGAYMAARADLYLMHGFTTVRDMGGNTFGLKRGIDSGEISGPRIYPSGAVIGQTGGHGDMRGNNDGTAYFDGPESRGMLEKARFTVLADGKYEVMKAARDQFARGASQLKVLAGGGAASLKDPLDATQFTLEEIRTAVQEAERLGSYVTVHAHLDAAINQALDAGVRGIEHGMLIEENTMKRMAELGAFLSPQAYLVLQKPEDNPEMQNPIQIEKMRRVNAGAANEFKWAKKYGVKVLWGTDAFGTSKNVSTTLKKEWEYRDPFFTPVEQLKQATGNGGEVLLMSGLKNPYQLGPLGVIEPGAYADILLIEGDPTKDILIMSDPEKNFKIIMKDGKIYKNTLE